MVMITKSNIGKLKDELLGYANKYGENGEEKRYIYRLIKFLVIEDGLDYIKFKEAGKEPINTQTFVDSAVKHYLTSVDFLLEEYAEENSRLYVPLTFGDESANWYYVLNSASDVTITITLNKSQIDLLNDSGLMDTVKKFLIDNHVCQKLKFVEY